MKHDPNFRAKENKLTFSQLPASLRRRFSVVQDRIGWIGITLDRDVIHVGFSKGGCEYWKRKDRRWTFLIGGYPAESDLPSLLRAVA